MAQPSPAPISAADRIRALTNEDAIFHAFDSYPWSKDKTFLSGLHAILGDPEDPQGSLEDMATHARVFYYAKTIGVAINFSRYQSWCARNPSRKAPDVVPEEYLTGRRRRQQISSLSPTRAEAEAAAEPLSWQQAAPKADLYIDRKAASQADPLSQASGGDKPEYPMGFAEIFKLIQEGKEVPGIRKIPNTVLREPHVRPVGSKTVPRKPWEKGNAAVAASSSLQHGRDLEFPPVDSAPGGTSPPSAT